jgi:anti-repressor protein
VFQTELSTARESNLMPFQFQGYTVQVDFDGQGELWFIAKDVCDALGIDVTQIRRLDDDEKGLRSIQTLGGIQQIQCVNEAGLYNLILSCRKFKGEKGERIKQFKRWVTHEILPQIRRQGYYNIYGKIDPSIQSMINEVAQATLEKVTEVFAPLTKNPVISVETQETTVEKVQVSFQVKLSFGIKKPNLQCH